MSDLESGGPWFESHERQVVSKKHELPIALVTCNTQEAATPTCYV